MDNLEKCPRCKKGVIELIPLYDNDQTHKKEQVCVFCKRKARKNGLPLTYWGEKMPSVDFEDEDLLKTIQNETGFDMTNMFIVKKEIIDNKVRVFYKPKR